MTGLWGPAMDAEVTYRRAAVRAAYPRGRAERPLRRRRPVQVRRAVTFGAVGVAGAAAGVMTASGRR